MNTTVGAKIDANTVDCLREVKNIGSTTVMNICTDTAVLVPWGTMDWLGFTFLGMLLALVLVFILVLVLYGSD